MEFLKLKNPHERDTHIKFDEGPHIYTIKGDSKYLSVTTWNHNHFEKFDADRIIKKMMKSKNWPNSKYFNMSPDEIKAGWEENRDKAANDGTRMHENIEKFYNNCPVDDESIEYTYFKVFYEKYKEQFMAYRTEWMIYDEELKLAGSIDIIFIDKEGNLHIGDWKRSKEIKKIPFGNKCSNNPIISHIPDCNIWHYSLQLNTYKAIIERNYNKKIKNMFLICLHPDNPNKSYIKMEVPDLQEEINELFNERKTQLNNT